MEFGEILQRELDKQGKTQVWLAKQMGVTPGAVTGYLNGNPTWKVIQRINKVLPLPEAAALLHEPDVIRGLSALSAEFSDVLEDPQARDDFDALVSTISQLSPMQMRGLRLLLSNDNTPAK